MADLEHLHPVFRERVLAALDDYSGAWVLSGARSNARQRQLYNDFLAGRGNPANPPGSSWHEYDETAPWPNVTAEHSRGTAIPGGCWAMAVDLAGSYAGIRRNAGAYGLCFPISGEDWHAQPAEISEARRVSGAWSRLPAPSTPGPTPTPTPTPIHDDAWADLFVPVLIR